MTVCLSAWCEDFTVTRRVVALSVAHSGTLTAAVCHAVVSAPEKFHFVLFPTHYSHIREAGLLLFT